MLHKRFTTGMVGIALALCACVPVAYAQSVSLAAAELQASVATQADEGADDPASESTDTPSAEPNSSGDYSENTGDPNAPYDSTPTDEQGDTSNAMLASGRAGECEWSISQDGTLTIVPVYDKARVRGETITVSADSTASGQEEIQPTTVLVGELSWDGEFPPWYKHRDLIQKVSIPSVILPDGEGEYGYPSGEEPWGEGAEEPQGEPASADPSAGDSDPENTGNPGNDPSDGADEAYEGEYYGPCRVVPVTCKNMFKDCVNLGINVGSSESGQPSDSVDLWGLDTSAVTDMSSMFQGCTSLTNFSSVLKYAMVTNLSNMFQGCSSLSILYITANATDFANATDLSGMFSGCSQLGVQPGSPTLEGWNLDSADSLAGMFEGCTQLRSLPLKNSSAVNATDASGMFKGCENLESVSFADLNMANVQDLSSMFEGCKSLTSVAINTGSADTPGLNTSNAISMASMFAGCAALKEIDEESLDTSSATDLSSLFAGCAALTSLDVSGYDTSKVQDFSGMFSGCSGLNELVMAPAANAGDGESGQSGESGAPGDPAEPAKATFTAAAATDLSSMFAGCSSLQQIDLANFAEAASGDVAASSLFAGCTSLTGTATADDGQPVVDLSSFSGASLTAVDSLFADCSSVKSVDLTGVDVSKAESTANMFSGCTALESLDVSGLDTSNVTSMDSMFKGCKALTDVTLATTDPDTGKSTSKFDTSNVSDMDSLFSECSSLTSVDLTGLQVNAGTSVSSLFEGCSQLKTVTVGDSWNAAETPDMFTGTALAANSSGIASSSLFTYEGDDFKRFNMELVGYAGLENGVPVYYIQDFETDGQDADAVKVTPEVKVTNGSTVLEPGKDYTVTYDNNDKIGNSAYANITKAGADSGPDRQLQFIIANKPSDKPVTIEFLPNAGEDEASNMPDPIEDAHVGDRITLPSGRPERTNFAFAGWSADAEGTVVYRPGEQYPVPEVPENPDGDRIVTLYAIWTAAQSATVTFAGNANDATDPPEDILTYVSASISLPAGPTRAGYTFAGWSTARTGDAQYQAGELYEVNAVSTTLYAIWTSGNAGDDDSGNGSGAGGESDKGSGSDSGTDDSGSGAGSGADDPGAGGSATNGSANGSGSSNAAAGAGSGSGGSSDAVSALGGTALSPAETAKAAVAQKQAITTIVAAQTSAKLRAVQAQGAAARIKGIRVGATAKVGGATYKAISGTQVVFAKAPNKKTVTVPNKVKIKGKTYTVAGMGSKAFAKATKARTVVVKAKALAKARVKNCLTKSKVTKVQVKSVSAKVKKKYRTWFRNKKVVGKKVNVK